LENDFIFDLRAQNWYNNERPRNLTGFINDKTNRLIGSATMRQLRIKSHPCPNQKIESSCEDDYNMLNEDTNSYEPEWKELKSSEEYSSSIIESFKYKLSTEIDRYICQGEHETYSGNGYIYKFGGDLFDLQNNLTKLKKLKWIDEKTRAIFLEFTLYNPNVELLTSVRFLTEFLSTGEISPQYRFDPINISGK
jgi:hypothetical protein